MKIELIPTGRPKWAFPTLLVGMLAVLPNRIEGESSPRKESIDWDEARKWWAFQPVKKSKLPEVTHTVWPRNRIDYFILAKLEENKLVPTTKASKRILARRLFFDLTGLPPNPLEMEAFLTDEAEEAYVKLAEDLIHRRTFGERMGSMWLNTARYAEDQAHQVGNDTAFFYPNAYRYRGWVIDAFNKDLSYDQFVRMQIAADLMETKKVGDLPALGFIGLGHKYYDRGRLAVKAEEWAEQIDTLTRAFLGLTVACAQCHDHKYDPITQKDYYALAGVFASTELVNVMEDGSEIKKGSEAEKKQVGTIHIVKETKAQDLNVFIRGNVETKGEPVKRRFLRVLSGDEPKPFREGSGRMELAEAIANPKNPLTARVVVNRIWSLFFGRGLVDTPSNFGRLGVSPSHPELLDDLAMCFMEHGWSLKWLVSQVVLSSTYQQASFGSIKSEAIDPENIFLWRMNRRRLSVEQWRDSVLVAAGNLDCRDGKSLELSDPKNRRRTVYGRISRKKLNDLLMQFDYPDANIHAAKRSETTTAIQKLFVMNNPFMVEQAKRLAGHLTRDLNIPDETRIHDAYILLYSREPNREEVQFGLAFLSRTKEGELSRWEKYAHALLSTNEMMFID